MDVRCDRCETEYELDDAIVTDAGASVQCTTCGHTFIVTRRPSSPLNHMGLTPPGGLDSRGPEVPEWTLSTDDGKVHRFRDLNTLQKWIVERKVGRNERISRAGGPWLALEDVIELTPFFNVVDEADRARAMTGMSGGMPTAPTFPAGSGGWKSDSKSDSKSDTTSDPSSSGGPGGGSPPARAPSGPVRVGEPRKTSSTPPPVPLDARRPISEDGPTVPNRRLPETEFAPVMATITPAVPATGAAISGAGRGPGAVSIAAATTVPMPAPFRLPGVRDSQSASGAAAGRRTPDARPSAPSNAATSSSPHSSSSAALMAAAAKEGIRRASTGGARPWERDEREVGAHITAETQPLESDLLRPSHQGRNGVAVIAVLILVASGGGWWWWQEQQQKKRPQAQQAPQVPAQPAQQPPPERNPSASTSPATAPAPTAGGAPVRVPAAPAAFVAPARTTGAPQVAAASSAGTPRAGRAASQGGATRAGGSAGASSTAGSYDRLVAEADRLLERGKSAKADKLYAQALAARPDGVAALTGAAYVLLDRQRHFKAIETFRRALGMQPTYGPALFGIAESYRARGDSAQALGAYRQYLTIAPSGTDAPAARRQIKDLESAASAAAPAAGDRSPPPDESAAPE